MIHSRCSSNTTLHVHLDNEHHDEYIMVCKQKGWEIKIASACRSQLGIVSALDTQRIPFSQVAFIQNLVMFIAANDQVH